MNVLVATIQMAMSLNPDENMEQAMDLVTRAARDGAQVILLPELFHTVYFCQKQEDQWFDLAFPRLEHPFLSKFARLAKDLGVCLPISFFEKDGPQYYNSLEVFDRDGSSIGFYRKAHIPDGPCYQEKYYFRPGNTGPVVAESAFGKIGLGICWDQWFPEWARLLALGGAQMIVYPTAIGTEPPEAGELDTKDMWCRAMQGHAVCNSVAVVASNRIGKEEAMSFYGHSLVIGREGQILQQMGDSEAGYRIAELDFSDQQRFQASMGFFRDRQNGYGL